MKSPYVNTMPPPAADEISDADVYVAPKANDGWSMLAAGLIAVGVLMMFFMPADFSGPQQNNRGARIALEIAALAQAIEAYKLNAGDYPPNFDDEARLRRHISLRWQQIPRSEADQFVAYIQGQAKEIDPAEALVFWLGGPSPNGQLKANDVMPLTGAGEPKSYYGFDQTRMTDIDNDGWSEYAAPGCLNAPFIYFESRSYQHYRKSPFIVGKIDDRPHGWISPARSSKDDPEFMNAKSFQIFAAGRDGKFHGGATYPAGRHRVADQDNIANFSEGRTFEEAKP